MQKGYIGKRLLRSVISILIIMLIVFTMVYTLVPRENIFLKTARTANWAENPTIKRNMFIPPGRSWTIWIMCASTTTA